MKQTLYRMQGLAQGSSEKAGAYAHAAARRAVRHTVDLCETSGRIFGQHEKDAFLVIADVAVALDSVDGSRRRVHSGVGWIASGFLSGKADCYGANGEGWDGAEEEVGGEVEDVGEGGGDFCTGDGYAGGYCMFFLNGGC